MSTPLLVDRPEPGVVRLRLDRPGRRNAVDPTLLACLRRALAELRDDPSARAVVLASSRPGMFCAGADLSIADDLRAQVSRGFYELCQEMITLPVPVVAALAGPAVGGGAQLAIAADVRIAHPDAWVRFVGPGHGLAVGGWALTSLVGRGRGVDLCLSGRRVDAHEAVAIGLVTRVDDDPEERAVEYAAAVAALDRDAVARTKEQSVLGLRERLDREAAGNATWDGRAAAG